jgi:high-affinity iron transporter
MSRETQQSAGTTIAAQSGKTGKIIFRIFLAAAALIIAAVLIWQGVTAAGSPDPTVKHIGTGAAILDIGVLVFREGLECILVLTAVTASMQGANKAHRRPIAIGVGMGFIVTLAIWFVAVGIINDLTQSIPALDVQAATGLLAIVVLLIVMNWFFHKVYWTGWISHHNRRKKELLQKDKEAKSTNTAQKVLWGFILLGFTSFLREGVEVVLFLQSYRLQLGGMVVLQGVILGGIFSILVAILTFVANRRLPYKKMLVVTGVMLGAVLLVMVGEQVLEMQQAMWISTTPIPGLQWIPDWAGVWFSIFPNWETVIAQVVAAILVIGSYFMARYQAVLLPKKRGEKPAVRSDAPPANTSVATQSASIH